MFSNFLSNQLTERILSQPNALPVPQIEGLTVILDGDDTSAGLDPAESVEALQFVVNVYKDVEKHLENVLTQRHKDRVWLDAQVSICAAENALFDRKAEDADFASVIGRKDVNGRIVVGPLDKDVKSFTTARGNKIAELPSHLKGPHVTLFGPADTKKMAINAMNGFHRKIENEPKIIEKLCENYKYLPKWGADDEDSKTPQRNDLRAAMRNLDECFRKSIKLDENYKLASSHLAQPFKRIPGLALPSTAHFLNGQPLPLHLVDFALHLFHLNDIPEALSFYVPKLENEEEAAYMAALIAAAEKRIQKINPNYKAGTVRILVVLENPRAVFRVNEMMDALYPYFAAASLGWHDYLAAAARLFREDPSYRIPVKSDPNIVLRHIRESHLLLQRVVAARGGIAIGGMYGVLPRSNSLKDPSMQVSLIGFVKDIVTQLRRGLHGFWVAHPDFVRIGIALVQAYQIDADIKLDQEDTSVPKALTSSGQVAAVVRSLILDPTAATNLIEWLVQGETVASLDASVPQYNRALLAAELADLDKSSQESELRYNVFQAVQYLAAWLGGNGCVALPAHVGGEIVRVMDDLATTERSRWEVWAELRHQRVSLSQLLSIVCDEINFIRADRSTPTKQVQVKYTKENARWYTVAEFVLLRLMTDMEPVEFVTELLFPFLTDEIRASPTPLLAALSMPGSVLANKTSPFFIRYLKAYRVMPCDEFALTVARAPARVAPRRSALQALEQLSSSQVTLAAGLWLDEARLFEQKFGTDPARIALMEAFENDSDSHSLFRKRIAEAWPEQDDIPIARL